MVIMTTQTTSIDRHSVTPDKNIPTHMKGSGRTSNRSIFSYNRMIFRYSFAKKIFKEGAILDIGCGYGYGLDFFPSHTYYGIDFDKELINANSDHFKRGTFIHMNVPPLNFPDESFENILCAEMIEHVEPLKALTLLKECYRVSKDNGTLFLSTPNAQNRIQKAPDHYIEYKIEDIQRLLIQAGWTILKQTGSSIELLKNRYQDDSLFNILRGRIYQSLTAKNGSSGNKEISVKSIKKSREIVKTIFKGIAKPYKHLFFITLTGLAKAIVYTGYLFPNKAEYQIWVCMK